MTMANINNEALFNNEMMSEEQLRAVAGGTMGQTSEDSKLLYEYGLLDDYHREFHTIFHWESDSATVDAGWAKAGITCITKHVAEKCNGSNQYFLNGKEFTQEEAHDYLKTNFKKIRTI